MGFSIFIIIWYIFAFTFLIVFILSFLRYRKWKKIFIENLPKKNEYSKIIFDNFREIQINFSLSKNEFIIYKFDFKVMQGMKTFNSNVKQKSLGKLFKWISISKSNKKSYQSFEWINIGKSYIYLSNKYIYIKTFDLIQKQVFKYSIIEEIQVDNDLWIHILFKNKRESLKIFGKTTEYTKFLNLIFYLMEL